VRGFGAGRVSLLGGREEEGESTRRKREMKLRFLKLSGVFGKAWENSEGAMTEEAMDLVLGRLRTTSRGCVWFFGFVSLWTSCSCIGTAILGAEIVRTMIKEGIGVVQS